MKEIYLGLDLCKKNIQMSYFREDKQEPESIYQMNNTETYQLPNVMFYAKELASQNGSHTPPFHLLLSYLHSRIPGYYLHFLLFMPKKKKSGMRGIMSVPSVFKKRALWWRILSEILILLNTWLFLLYL